MISMRYFGSERTARALGRSQAARIEIGSRLSSGYRIQKASDGAAELAIISRAKARRRSQRAAHRNIGEALDIHRVAEGGLNEIHGVLTRMRELAMQSANGTLSPEDRYIVEREFRQLIESIDQVATSTSFNNQELLTRELLDIGFVVDASGSMSTALQRLKDGLSTFTDGLRDKGYDVQFGLSLIGDNHDSVDGVKQTADIGDPSFQSDLDSLTTGFGYMDPVSGVLNTIGDPDVAGDAEPDALTWRGDAERMLIVLTDTGREVTLTSDTAADAGNAAAAAGVTVNIIGEPTADDVDGIPGSDLADMATISGGSYLERGGVNGFSIADSLDSISESLAPATVPGRLGIQAGPDAGDRIVTNLPYSATSSALGLSGASVVDVDSALEALGDIDAAISQLSSIRADAGATMNRLESAMRSLDMAEETSAATISRIEDADMAQETANLVRASILTEAGAAVLAQTHELAKENVLSLLP